MIQEGYSFAKSDMTYTLDDYIASKSNDVMSYFNTSFLQRRGNIVYSVYNVASDYIDELRSDYCVEVELSDNELAKYKYKPKLLCYDLYGNTELAFIILFINDMYSATQFKKKKLKLPTVDMMNDLSQQIVNSNRVPMQTYNSKNNTRVAN